MVDNMNPTSQFHPYQPQDATPQTGTPKSGWGSVLERAGIDRSKIDAMTRNMDLSKARSMAQRNGGMVLGGLAALVIGAGLMRRRSAAR